MKFGENIYGNHGAPTTLHGFAWCSGYTVHHICLTHVKLRSVRTVTRTRAKTYFSS